MMESSSFQPSVRRTTMKMASVSVVSVFLLCCSAVASQGCDKILAVNQSFSVPLDNKGKSLDRLKWKFEGTVIFHKRETDYITGKADNINADGSLKLTNLKKEQAGLYTPEIFDKNGKSQTLKSTKLCVLDPVKKPKLKEICQETKVKFECDLGLQPPDAVLEWLQNKNPIANEKNKVLEKKIADLKKDTFVCKVSNKASTEESNAVVHSCGRTSIPSIPGLPEELWGINIWVYVGGGGGIVILLIIIVIFCCVRTKRTRKLRLKDEEELRLEWTNTDHHPNHPPLPDHPPPHHPNRHHHHHHHHQQQQEQQQAPGNTGPRQSRSKQSRQPRARAPEPNGQPQPTPRRTGQAQKPAKDADDEQPPPLPQPRKKGPKTQLD